MAQQQPRQDTKVPSLSNRPAGGGAGRFAPNAKPKNAKGTLLRIIKIYMQWGKTILVAMLLTAIASGIAVSIPYFTGKTFNTFDLQTRTVNIDDLLRFLLILLSLHVCSLTISWINGIIMLKVSQKLVFTIRNEVFSKMQKLPLQFYDTRSHGDTMSRITNDVDNISSTIAQTTTQLVSSILTLAGSLIVMISLSIPLTLIVLLVIPLVALLTKSIASKSRAYFRAQSKSLGELNGVIEENIQGLKMVKAFGKQQDMLNQFNGINEQLYDNSKKAMIWSGYMMPLMNVINNFVFALVSIIGGILTIEQGLVIGTVVSFLSYSKQFAFPLNAIAGMFNTIQSALAGAERVFELFDSKEEPSDLQDAIDIKNPKGYVVFDDVSFS
ncbi:MAG TPA: multidrug ABC transporter ATP-binding protein, partial [Clostridiales bacterium]|nr:multidrug ABC transporter ATP-binding protein [Clostridiales bacterium]